MEIHFFKHADDRHSIEVRGRQRGPDIRRPPRETGPTMPHDLVHAVVEQALGLDRGFWAAVDRGATFEGFVPLEPGRHARSGLKELRRIGEAELAVEHMVSWARRVWSGQRSEGTGLGPAVLTAEQLRVTSAALDSAMERWRRVPPEGVLVWQWT
jgi:hypothetical protein